MTTKKTINISVEGKVTTENETAILTNNKNSNLISNNVGAHIARQLDEFEGKSVKLKITVEIEVE